MGSEQLPKHMLLSLLNVIIMNLSASLTGIKDPLSTKHTEFFPKFYRLIGALEVSHEPQIKKT